MRFTRIWQIKRQSTSGYGLGRGPVTADGAIGTAPVEPRTTSSGSKSSSSG
jgi:hypothetical protein